MWQRFYSLAGAVAAAVVVVLWAVPADADDPRGTAEVPVQVGVGPTGVMFGGPTFDEPGWGGGVFDDQPIHGGLRLDVTAVVDEELVEEHPQMVPSNYRGMVREMDEVRYSPAILSLIPSTIYLSPPVDDAAAWGASWSLLGVGLAPISEPVRLGLGASLGVSALYISSEAVRSPYLFLRPNIEVEIEVEIPVSDSFLMSLGWASTVHAPPQPLQGGVTDAGSFDEHSLWHFGQFFIQGHFRFPYEYNYAGR